MVRINSRLRILSTMTTEDHEWLNSVKKYGKSMKRNVLIILSLVVAACAQTRLTPRIEYDLPPFDPVVYVLRETPRDATGLEVIALSECIELLEAEITTK